MNPAVLLSVLWLAHMQFCNAALQRDKRSTDSKFADNVCALEKNETLNILFQNKVRQEYGAAPEDDDGSDGEPAKCACVRGMCTQSDNVCLWNDAYALPYAAYYTTINVDEATTLICHGCPEALKNDVTWCVHIYDPVDDVKICINVTGVVNKTVVAAELRMEEVLFWKKVVSCK